MMADPWKPWLLSDQEAGVLVKAGLSAPDRNLFGLALSDDGFVGGLIAGSSPSGIARHSFRIVGSRILSLIAADFYYRVCGIRDVGVLSKIVSCKTARGDICTALANAGFLDLARISASAPTFTKKMSRQIAEQFVGAVAKCYGYNRTFNLLRNAGFLDGSEDGSVVLVDEKSRLQEYTQATWRIAPRYEVVKSEGPDHAKAFWVEAVVRDKKCAGLGLSKRAAEKDAASKMLAALGVPHETKPLRGTRYSRVLTKRRLDELQTIADGLGITLCTPEVFDAALTHTSCRADHGPGIETWEGLACVGAFLWQTLSAWCIASPETYLKFGAGDFPGYAANVLPSLCARGSVASSWAALNLDRYVLMTGAQRGDGLSVRSQSDLAQALLAACFYNTREQDRVNYFGLTRHLFLSVFILDDLEQLLRCAARDREPKTLLQEYLQALGFRARYALLSTESRDERPIYTHSVELQVVGKEQRPMASFKAVALGQRADAERIAADQATEWLKGICSLEFTRRRAPSDIEKAVCSSVEKACRNGALAAAHAADLLVCSGLNALMGYDFPAAYLQLVEMYRRLLTLFPGRSPEWLATLYQRAVGEFRRQLAIGNLPAMASALSMVCAEPAGVAHAETPGDDCLASVKEFLSYAKCFSGTSESVVDINELLTEIQLLCRRKGPMRMVLGTIRPVRANRDVLLLSLHGILKNALLASSDAGVVVKTFTDTRDREVKVAVRYSNHAGDTDGAVDLGHLDELALNLGRANCRQTEGNVEIVVSFLYVTADAVREPPRYDGSIFMGLAQDEMAGRLTTEDAAHRMASSTMAQFQNALVSSYHDLTSVGAVVHDVKNGILALEALAATKGADGGKRYGAVSAHLAQRIDALQRYALVNVSMKRVRIDVRSWFAEVVSAVRPMIPENVLFTAESDELDAHVNGDPELLASPIMTFVKNAVEAMPSGGRVSVTAIVDRVSQVLALEVEDSGSGIPCDIKEALLHAAITTKKSTGGTGLGLLTAKRILDSHDGSISISSSGTGTVIGCRIPLLSQDMETEEATDPGAEPRDGWRTG